MEWPKSFHSGQKLLWSCLKDKTISKHLLHPEHKSNLQLLWAFHSDIFQNTSLIQLQWSKSKSDLETRPVLQCPTMKCVSFCVNLHAGRQRTLQWFSNKLTKPSEGDSFCHPSVGRAGHATGSISNSELILQFFPSYKRCSSDAAEPRTAGRLQWEPKAERWEKIPFLTTKSSHHTSSFVNCALATALTLSKRMLLLQKPLWGSPIAQAVPN